MTDVKRTYQQTEIITTSHGTAEISWNYGPPIVAKSTPDLTVTESLELAEHDAPELAARLRRGNKVLAPSLWPSKHVQWVRRLRWRWYLTDPAGGNTLADGYSLFEAWAWHRASVKAAEIYIERLAKSERQAES